MQEQIIALFRDAFGSDVTITTTNLSLVVEYAGEDMASWTSFLEKLGKEFNIDSFEERIVSVINEEAMEKKRQEYVSILEEMGFQELAGYCRSAKNAPAEYQPTVAETTVISLYSAALAVNQVTTFTSELAEVVLKQGLGKDPTPEEVSLFLEIQEPFNKYLVKRDELAVVKRELAELVAKRDSCLPDTLEHTGLLMGISSRIGRQDSIERTLKPLVTTVRFLAGI